MESLGLFIFFIGLLPFSNVFFVARTILAERYLYFPSLGLCILIGVIGSWLIGQNEKTRLTAVYAVFVIMVAVMLVMSISRNTVWKNDTTLFKSVLRVYPDNIKALNNLAVIHFNKGEYREAIPLYEGIVQKYPQVYPAQARLIFAHYSLANYDKAIAYGRKAIQYFSNNENIYDLLGEVYEKASKPNDAIAVYEKGIKVMPKSFLMNFRLGAWYQKAGDCKKAEIYLQSALKISNDVNVHYYLGKCYYSEGRGKEAFNEFIKCTKVYKRYPDILKYIILLYIDFNNFALAEQIAAQYVKEFPDDAEAWAVTGKLYWQGTRDSNYAKQFIQKALVLDSKICIKIDYIAVCRAVGY